MDGVIEVNVAFREGIHEADRGKTRPMARASTTIPANTAFNPKRDLPTLAGQQTRDPQFRNRIIGAVALADTKRRARYGDGIASQALRADEGEPFTVGTRRDDGEQHDLPRAGAYAPANSATAAPMVSGALCTVARRPYGDNTVSGSKPETR